MDGPVVPFRSMMARVSPDDIVLYANRALAAYLRVSKQDLIGAPLETLAARVSGEVATCFVRPGTGRQANRLVTDADGRVFELKTSSEGGVLDIVLDEVTHGDEFSRDLAAISGTSVDVLNEEELRTARQPERRFMTVSFVRLDSLMHLAERLAPMEIRLMVNSFAEEAADAILETGCTVHHVGGGAVEGLFGAPRYFADHALRAVRAASRQMARSTELREGFFRQGKEMPPVACGIWTGETFVGTLGSSGSLQYAAVGEPVELAEKLSRLARPGEVLLPEFTLRQLIQNLPEGWEFVRAESESDPDLSDFHWSGDEITTLPEQFVRGVWLIGPGVRSDASQVEFYLDYLWALRVPGHEEPVPILRLVRPALVGDSFELNAENVVSPQFSQMLGKYRLLEVIGTGGMGKVWKAKDRYGNVVAIKVLHTNESTSEAQLRRFRREAEIMARLPHRNICRVFEMSEFEGIHFIVMEFVDGLTLADLLYERTAAESAGTTVRAPDLRSLIQTLRTERSTRSDQPPAPEDHLPPRPKATRVLPVEQTLSVFGKVCEAVQFAHEHGVLHRDLKPGNILLREDGEPLVADFGLAKFESEGGHSLSVTGHVVGTLENMSPEQAESSKSVDERADVFSLGTILFQMLTGRRHFEATGNIVADAQALQTHEAPRPRAFNSKLDADLEIIVLKALRNAPAERYRSVAALHADLERFRRGEVISARPVSALELARKLVLRNRAVSAVIVASVLIMLAGSAAAFWKITERAKAAEEARVAAEEARAAAENALREAEIQRKAATDAEAVALERQKEAEAGRKELEAALAQVSEAREAEQKAHELAKGLRQETEAEREARERADAALREAEERARASEERAAELENRQTVPELPPRPPLVRREDPEVDEARRAMAAAMRTFHMDVSPYELSRYQNNPDMIVRKVSGAQESVSSALLADPGFVPGWMLKGRLHFALLETAAAADAFSMAGRIANQRRADGGSDFLMGDNPEKLLELARQAADLSSDRFGKASVLMRETGQPADQVVSDVLQFLSDKPVAKRSVLGSHPTGREPSAVEAALSLLARSSDAGKVDLQGNSLTISNIEDLSDLSPLRSVALSKLKIEGARKLDWSTLAALPIESLDLSGSPLEMIPPNLRGFTKLRHVHLRDSAVADVTFARAIPLLESLDVSNTLVTDVAPLGLCRRVRTLDISRLAAENLRALLFVPLERLTLSPMLITDRPGFESLRGHRTLRVLRSPDDPADQPAPEFWRRLDNGQYATGG